ncbi:MAG: PD40 domain-containing protein, partial [Acidobacteriota bacterium]
MGIRCLSFCVILLSLSPVTVSAQEVFRPLRGPYLGQEAGIRPQIFLPGKISSGSDEGSPLFYPGALSFMWMTKRSGVEVAYLLEDRDGRWQQPERVEFFKEPSRVWDLTLAPDGESIYFVSDRQGEFGGANIWWVPLDGGRWGSPQILSAEVNSEAEESHPTVALNGDLYFTRVEPGDRSEADLFVARRKGQAFAPAARLSGSVNAAEADYDPFIAPDGSYLIFASRRPGGSGLGDLYISYRLAAGSEGSTPPDGVLAELEREG